MEHDGGGIRGSGRGGGFTPDEVDFLQKNLRRSLTVPEILQGRIMSNSQLERYELREGGRILAEWERRRKNREDMMRNSDIKTEITNRNTEITNRKSSKEPGIGTLQKRGWTNPREKKTKRRHR